MSDFADFIEASYRIYKGEAEPSPEVTSLIGWLDMEYGTRPLNARAVPNADGVLTGVTLVYWDRLPVRELKLWEKGKPTHHPRRIAERCRAVGLVAADVEVSERVRVQARGLRAWLLDRVYRAVRHEDVVAAAVAVDPRCATVSQSGYLFRVWTETDVERHRLKQSDVGDRLSEAFGRLLRAADVDGLSTDYRPLVAFESEQELREVYDGNLRDMLA